LTWEADDPQLTPCFELTVLVYAPCAFLWLFAILEIYYIRISYDRLIPTNKLNISKLAVIAFLVLVTIADVVYAITHDGQRAHPVHFYTPVIKIATFVSFTSCFLAQLQSHHCSAHFRYSPVC